jgi:hypothetical protein
MSWNQTKHVLVWINNTFILSSLSQNTISQNNNNNNLPSKKKSLLSHTSVISYCFQEFPAFYSIFEGSCWMEFLLK